MADVSPTAKLAARRIRELRVEKRLTQEKLAYLAGLNKGQMSKIEREKSEPGVGTLEKIAKALGVHLADLLVDPAASEAERAISALSKGRA